MCVCVLAKQEYEAYISQLERDNNVPENKEIIRPKVVPPPHCCLLLGLLMTSADMTPYDIHHVCGQAGFCIKTRNKSDDAKFFINVCHHERIEKPSMKALPDGRQHWSVPNSLGPPRMEKDNCTCCGCHVHDARVGFPRRCCCCLSHSNTYVHPFATFQLGLPPQPLTLCFTRIRSLVQRDPSHSRT